MIKEKEEAYKLARITKVKTDWETAKSLWNQVSAKCKKAKDEFTKETIENSKENPKKFWLNLNKLWGDKKSKTTNDLLLTKAQTNEKCNKTETCDIFNQFFTSVAKDIQESIPQLNRAEKTYLDEITAEQTSSLNFSFTFSDVSYDELKRILKKIDNYKSSGIEKMTSKIRKTTLLILISQFKFIINLALRTSIFPKKWKEALVTPLYKAGQMDDPNNYRPIACIPLPGKIFEKCIFSQFYNYLEVNEFLSPVQFGFRRNLGTQQAVSLFLDNIYYNLNSNNICLATFIDLKKAFDTVNHIRLLNKLKNSYNLHEQALNLFKDYLNDRTQKVIANNHISNPLKLTTGVPQGSCLGPLLFITYINNITRIMQYCKIILFADDTVIYHSSPSFESSHPKMQHDLNNLDLWCRENLLQINVSKTKSMIFSTKNQKKTT